MATVKVLKKFAMQQQSGSPYEDDSMFLMPLVGGILGQTFDPIADESISGEAFKAIPQQGGKHVGGDGLSFNLDELSNEPLFRATFPDRAGAGTTASPYIYTLGNENVWKLSIAALDDVKCNEYTSCYVKKLGISSAANDVWKLDSDFVCISQNRQAPSHFPASTIAFTEPMVFHEAGGSEGYVRVGDDTDALDSGDDIKIEDFSLEIQNGFDNQYTNTGVTTLKPVFGMSAPTLTGSFTVARHNVDTWLAWQDDHEALQMEINIYKSATKIVKIQIPRFVITAELSDDDLTKIPVTMLIGRNGIGSTVINPNMDFVSPVRISVTNRL